MPDNPRAKAERDALQEAGLVRLPTLWVYPEEAAAIYRVAEKHRKTVHKIKKEVRRARSDSPE